VGKNEDASVEPRQGRISSFLLAPLGYHEKGRCHKKKKTNPKGQSKSKSSPVQIQKSKAIEIILSN